MATKPDSLTGQPTYTHCVVMLAHDSNPSAWGEVQQWCSSGGEATTFARTQAEVDHKNRYAVFECSQVFGAVQKVEMLYGRRG